MKYLLLLILFNISFPLFAKANGKVLFNTDQYQIKCDQINCQSLKIINAEGDEKTLKDNVNDEDEDYNLNNLDGLIVKFYKVDIEDYKMGRYLRIGYSLTGIVDTGDESFKHTLEKCAIIDLKANEIKDVGGARDEVCFVEDYLSQTDLIKLKQSYIKNKSFIYISPNMKNKTKMYLIKGDKVTLIDEKTDNSGQKWYFINYNKGKKELNMWIKAEAIDLEPKKKSIPINSSMIGMPVIKNGRYLI